MRALILIALSLPSFAQFDSLPVPGATHYLLQYKPNAATHYLLQYKPNAASTFAPYGNPILAPRALASLTIPVHAFDWVNARYKVSACNAAGCQDSAEISAQDLMLTSIGYFKASNPDPIDFFGGSVVLSQDGNTLVTSAWEDSNAQGVNGDQSDNTAADSGAVYVFRRNGAGWRQEAYLKGDSFVQYFGQSFPEGLGAISVSADGSVVAVGAPGQQDGRTPLAGAVYLFTRAADGTWSQAQKIPALAPRLFYYFGASVGLSEDASVLTVTSLNPEDPEGADGTTHVFRNSGAGWVFEVTLPKDDSEDCLSQMSGNATVIMEICARETSARLRAHRRSGTNWVRMQDVTVSRFSHTSAVSGNGGRAAVASNDYFAGVGRVQMFVRVGNQWVVEQYIAPPPDAILNGVNSWGRSLAFDRSGTMLAIGDPTSTIGGAGVSDTIQPASSPPPSNQDGAVYVYRRGDSGWTLLKVVKAPNPAHGDFFGNDIALSGNGLTMAVGAPREDSAARGIDGDQADNSKEDAGAVYLY